MDIFLTEKDIDFCKNAINIIKNDNATCVIKDDSVLNDKKIQIYCNSENEVVININTVEYEKEGSNYGKV